LAGVSGALRAYGAHRNLIRVPPAFRTVLRTAFHADTYAAGVLRFTVPDHAYQVVLGSGMGRRIGAGRRFRSCLVSATRPRFWAPRIVRTSRYFGWRTPSFPASGIHDTISREPVRRARAITFGSTVFPPVTYTEMTRVAFGPAAARRAGMPRRGSSW
jgi:hypothetical protein